MTPKETEKLVTTIYALQARVDGLMMAIALLGKRLGHEPETMGKLVEDASRHALQKRLERIEDRAPYLSALLAETLLGEHEVDQSLLDELRWDDGYRPDQGE